MESLDDIVKRAISKVDTTDDNKEDLYTLYTKGPLMIGTVLLYILKDEGIKQDIAVRIATRLTYDLAGKPISKEELDGE